MPVLEGALSKERFIDQVVAQLTSMGSAKAARILEENWDYVASNFTFKQRYEEVGCYISYCNRADCEPEHLEKLVATIEGLLDEAPSPKDRAGLYNQKNRLYFGAYTTLEAKGEVHPEYLETANPGPGKGHQAERRRAVLLLQSGDLPAEEGRLRRCGRCHFEVHGSGQQR